MVWLAFLGGGTMLFAGCGDDESSSLPARSYVMGFSGLPPRPDLPTILETIEMWSQRSDAALILTEVPWDSLLAGKSAESLIRNDQLGLANYYRAKGLRVIASVDPTNGLDRASDSAALKAAGHSLTEPAMQLLYRNYVVAMQLLVAPDYLGIASETNLIRLIAPDSLYQAVKKAANDASTDILLTNATAKLFTTVQVEVAWSRLGSPGPYVESARTERISRSSMRWGCPLIHIWAASRIPTASPWSITIDWMLGIRSPC